jgi:hypothetical protein
LIRVVPERKVVQLSSLTEKYLGRADKPEDPYSPTNGTFEMDGSSAAPIELPAMSVSGPSSNAHKPSRLEPVQEVTTTDPRANLASVPVDDAKPVYVNRWDQYKNLE